MLKKVIHYTDFDGVDREETFYFNLTKAEVSILELSVEGGLVNKINKIAEERDGKEIIALFKEIIRLAYGEKSADGRMFVKSDEIFKKFESTQAYSDLFMELATDATSAAAFVNAIVPQMAEKK